jgi:hypothetical protein
VLELNAVAGDVRTEPAAPVAVTPEQR